MHTQNRNLSLYFPFRLFVFYLVGLTFWKLVFIWYNEVPNVLNSIIEGFRLDFSMICGVFLVGYIPYILYHIFGRSLLLNVTKYLHIMLWLVVCVIEFSSLLIYKEWGSTLDSRAISYLQHPQEAWASVRDFIPILPIFFSLVIVVSGVKRLLMLFRGWSPTRSYYLQTIPFLILIGPIAFLGLRGGWQKLPIVPSDAFYSSDMRNNFAATNKTWYFIYSLKKTSKQETFYSENEIQAYSQKYFKNTCDIDTFSNLWENKNIIFLIAEGWSADMVGYLYGNENVTPFFDSLSNESIRFTNAFSTGFRTDQGLMSIISGIPSIQSTNMPNVIDKVKNYPSLPLAMKSMGRATSFIYGGDLNFSNLYNYLTVMGFDTIIKDSDFNEADLITAWGIPDHITTEKAVDVISSHKRLFFSTVLLLSSHAPFDVPITNEFTKLKGHQSQYKSSVRYSDMALQRFFHLAKSKSWYNNAVFIITSDHGGTHSGWAGMEDHNRFRIPLLVFEPQKTMKIENQENTIPCNHFDLPKSVCKLTGANDSTFIFGRDIFCSDQSRKAYWNVDVAAGFYGVSENDVSTLAIKNDTITHESILFLDMIKSWFNTLR